MLNYLKQSFLFLIIKFKLVLKYLFNQDVLPNPKGLQQEQGFIKPPVKRENLDENPFPRHNLGPEAVFKDGVLGNYEPPMITAYGPGVYSNIKSYSSIYCVPNLFILSSFLRFM